MARASTNRRRRDSDENSGSFNERPEGILVTKLSDKVHLRVELSDFTGKDEVVVQKWILTNRGWTRAKGGIRLPPEEARSFCKRLYKSVGQLID